MIKNLVFDCGNVLIEWAQKKISCLLFPEDEKKAELVYENIIGSDDFYLWDKGELSDEELTAHWKKRMPEGYEDCVDVIIRHFSDVVPIKYKTCEFLHQMKEKGYKIYLLSNYNRHFEVMVNRLPVKEDIDGYVYSAKNQHIKPGDEIYHELLKSYHLKAEECFFIDDIEANINAALRNGFRGGYVFDENMENLGKAIKEISGKEKLK